VWEAKESSRARKAFENPELEFLQDYVKERAADLADDRWEFFWFASAWLLSTPYKPVA
jgi:hypothetical protein